MNTQRGQLIVLLAARALRLQAAHVLEGALLIEEIEGMQAIADAVLLRGSQVEHLAWVVESTLDLAEHDTVRVAALMAVSEGARLLHAHMAMCVQALDTMRELKRDREKRRAAIEFWERGAAAFMARQRSGQN